MRTSQIPASVRDRESWVDLKELDEHGQNLTQFEIEWVDSVMSQLLAGGSLSPRQREKLAQIREERL